MAGLVLLTAAGGEEGGALASSLPAPRQSPGGGAPLYSRSVTDPASLFSDDAAAASEAAAQAGIPGYCGDRLYAAIGGGVASDACARFLAPGAPGAAARAEAAAGAAALAAAEGASSSAVASGSVAADPDAAEAMEAAGGGEPWHRGGLGGGGEEME